jgi:hypothetical protein
MKQIEQESNLPTSTVNRRSFVKSVGFTGLGLAGAAIVGSQFGTKEQKVSARQFSKSV